jgi:hypothetical protein
MAGEDVAAPMMEAMFEKQSSAQAVWKSYVLAYLFPRQNSTSVSLQNMTLRTKIVLRLSIESYLFRSYL